MDVHPLNCDVARNSHQSTLRSIEPVFIERTAVYGTIQLLCRYDLETVSKSFNHDNHSSEFCKSAKERRIEFVASYQSSKGMLPTDRTFDFLPPAIRGKLSFVLGGRSSTVSAMRTDEFHITVDQVPTAQARQMQEDGYEPLLTVSRWLLLKRPENLSEK